MGFFSSIANSVSNGVKDAYEASIKANWVKMRNLDEERLIDICNTSDNSGIKTLAYILLSQKGNPLLMDINNKNEILDSVKRFSKKDSVMIAVGREWNEIREQIKRMKDNGDFRD
jgi:hypothetical protein